MGRQPREIRENIFLRRANALYDRLPIHARFNLDESEESGLEAGEIPDGYDRLGYTYNGDL